MATSDPSGIPDPAELERMFAAVDPASERFAASAEAEAERRAARALSADPAEGRTQAPGAQPTPARVVHLPAVTPERVAKVLEARGFHFETDSDGDPYAAFDEHMFSFMTMGDDRTVLQVRGMWAGSVPEGRETEAALMVNDWNREHYWPKVYTHHDRSGVLRVHGEVGADFAVGATDEQIDQLVLCGVHTCLDLFQHLTDRFSPSTTDEA